MKCADCRFCVPDKRESSYMRDPLCFCRKKARLFSRNHRPGEGGRILPGEEACAGFEPCSPASGSQTA